MSDLYQEIILEELKNLQHQGVLNGDQVIKHQEYNASCGDTVEVYVRLEAEQIQIKWKGTGCAISMTAMSLLTAMILDQKLTTDQILELNQDSLLELLGLDTVAPGRVKCLHLGLRSIKAAVQMAQIS